MHDLNPAVIRPAFPGSESQGIRIARTALSLWLAILAFGCASGSGPDILVERCTYVLAYRQPSLENLDVTIANRKPNASMLTLRYSAVRAPEKNPVSDLIYCAFDPENQWILQRVVVGDREFSEMEITLVNAELLLFDLIRYPQRFERPAAHAQRQRMAPTAERVES